MTGPRAPNVQQLEARWEAIYRFWDTIIEPVLAALQPKILVEIGSSHGDNTRNLLEFCQRNEAKLHVIDPLPKYSVSSWQELYGDHLTFHSALSLDAIPLIDQFDVVLIDGDHNWYTVFNELKLIERQCAKSSRPFPLVTLHDIAWPYGRRDLYYDPQTIPDAYRKPYEKKGVKPENTGLLENEGLNQGLFNASQEGDARNGVLTAVEDFLGQTEQSVELTKIPGLHGLGILVPTQLKAENNDLAQLLEALSPSPILTRYVEQVERVRVESEIRHVESEILWEKYRERSQAELRALRKEVTDKNRQLADFRRKLRKTSRETLRRIEQLDSGIAALLNSRPLKIGRVLGEARSRVLLKPRVPTAHDHLSNILKHLRQWRELYEEAREPSDEDGQ